MFIGREKELEKLDSIYKSKKLEIALLYGRRRIGKSQIIKESFNRVKNIPYVYFEAIEASEETNTSKLDELLQSKTGKSFNENNTFDRLLKNIFEYCLTNPLILALDEYPRLVRSFKSISSSISNNIDVYENKPMLKLILCGSEIDIMKSLFMADTSLYGRIANILPIRQQTYLESALFYPNYSNKEKLIMYTVFGGVPYYNQFIDDSKSVEENIINLIGNTNAVLLPEIESRLKIEISKMENCNEVLLAIAKNKHKFTDILNESHINNNPSLADALDKLKRLEIIQIVTPINESRISKKTNYYISDPLCKFYYKYIYWNYSSFQIMDSNNFFSAFIKESLYTQDVPFGLENITKQYFVINNLKNKYKPPLINVGKYYYNSITDKINGEIDVVTESFNGYIFYEVKCSKNKINKELVEATIEKYKALPIKYNNIGFISSSGYTNDIPLDKNYIYLTLDDLYQN